MSDFELMNELKMDKIEYPEAKVAVLDANCSCPFDVQRERQSEQGGHPRMDKCKKWRSKALAKAKISFFIQNGFHQISNIEQKERPIEAGNTNTPTQHQKGIGTKNL